MTYLTGYLEAAFPYSLCEDTFDYPTKSSRSLCTVAELLVIPLTPCFAIQHLRTSKCWSQSLHETKSESFLKSIGSTSSCVMKETIRYLYREGKTMYKCAQVPRNYIHDSRSPDQQAYQSDQIIIR